MNDRRAQVARDLLALAARYEAASAAWQQAMSDAIEHILIVARNNPNKPLKQIMARPDVREAISEPCARAGAETLQAVRESWFSAAGDVELPLEDLQRTLATVKNNTVKAPVRIRAAVLAGKREDLPDRLKKLNNSLIRRAAMSVEYAESRANMLKVLHGGTVGPGTMKTWKSRDWPGRCKHCKDLDGVTIPINAVFPHDPSLGTYGVLLGPPRHPHCQCRLEIS